MKEAAVEVYENRGGLRRRGEASRKGEKGSYFLACPLCLRRADRIASS